MPPLRVGLLCSRRAPGLGYLISHDANRGRLYDLACCLTSEEAFEDQATAAAGGVPVITHPIRTFCRSRSWRVSDPVGREAYDAEMAERLARYDLDLVVLTSYLYRLSEPMLAAFRHRIVNIHHSDLTLRNQDGSPRLPGIRAVHLALHDGLNETRATVHLVTRELDQGPPFLRSWAFPVSPLVGHALCSGADDVFRAYAYAHQEWMIRATWGPLASVAIELVARRHVDLAALATASDSQGGTPWELSENGRLREWSPMLRSA